MSRTLGTLQGGRWLAASAVMFAHAVTGVDAFVGPSGDVVRAVANRGYLGVDFFFVLSGFIIFHVHATDPRSLGAVASFAWRRAVRIYVPYLPIVAGLILLYQLLPEVSAAEREWSWVKSFTLLPVEGEPALAHSGAFDRLFRRHPVGHSEVSGHRIASPLSLVSSCQPSTCWSMAGAVSRPLVLRIEGPSRSSR